MKIVFTPPVLVKGFFTFKDKLPKDVMLPIMVRLNAILKSEFISLWKRWSLATISQHSRTQPFRCKYSQKEFSILAKESNKFKLKIVDSLLIVYDNFVFNEMGSSLFLEPFCYNVSGYYMMFYCIIWCPFLSLCINHCRVFRFQYYVTNFSIFLKTECMSI